jgi:BirA family biotin operon repressor/biotin-[acetyl-CoA-carboxylase] ligase
MLKHEILRLLRSATTGFCSGSELAAKLKVSRTAVWKHVRALAHEGYGIEAVPSQGYRLTSQPDILRMDDLQNLLTAKVIGRPVRYAAEVSSTNTLAMDLAHHGAAEGTVVVAERQTHGKGRLGRTWVSPGGNLYVSVILRPAVAVQKAPLATLMGAVAVASAVRERQGLAAGIKWPNDILLAGKKCCGLLTEMSSEPDRIKHIVLGIGVNVNMDLDALPPDVRQRSTSLAAVHGAPLDRTRLLADLLEQLDRWYACFLRSPGAVLDAWRRLNVTMGRSVSVRCREEAIEGVARDVDEDGRLIIAMPDGTERAVASGEVTLTADRSAEFARRMP